MRADISPLKEQILHLMSEYENVHFIACAGTLLMLRDKGVRPDIISGVSTDTSAFDYIVERLQNGKWTYIRAESLAEI